LKRSFTPSQVPGSQITGPLKINDRQQVVGVYIDGDATPSPDGTKPAAGVVHDFVWDDGDVTTIGVPGAIATFVLGINNHGDMVGSYIDPDGRHHGLLRDRRGAITTLPDAAGADPTGGGTQPVAINDRGHIIGLATTPPAASTVAQRLRPVQMSNFSFD
jgi:hypothetical protein